VNLETSNEEEVLNKIVVASDKEIAEYEPPTEKMYPEKEVSEKDNQEAEEKCDKNIKSPVGELSNEQIEEIKRQE